MTDSMPLEDDAIESLVAEATDDFLDRVQAGQQPAVEEYARRYPQIAGILRDLLPTVRLMQHSASDSAADSFSATGSFSAFGVVGLGAGEPLGCLGDFQLVREIGRGGMGIVYEAHQISLNRRVALKVLPFAAALDPKQLERFKHEAQAAAQLHHTHIVPVYAVGCERGVYYYAMQFIEGQSLSQLIHQLRKLSGRDREQANAAKGIDAPTRSGNAAALPRKPSADDADSPAPTVPPRVPAGDAVTDTTVDARGGSGTVHSIVSPAHFRTVANLGVQAAEALEHAHSLGVVHRDIKPGNLLVDAGGDLWVADFGLARFQTDAGLTISGDLVGTLRYMSPEQALARRAMVDHRTDIYAFGATLYELLTLEPVLAGHDRHELLQQIADEDPIAPRLFNEAIPVDLETIVLKATAKAVEDRYATAQDLADDLRRFLDDKPILAKPPTLWEKAGRWSRRHRTAVLSAVALLLVSFVGLAAATVLILHQEKETELAYRAEAQQRKRTEENFQQARQMLDFFTQVSNEDLADKPGVQAVRKKLLQAALDYYEDFIEQSDDDPSVHAELAADRLRVATILDEIGTQSDARVAFERARDYLHAHPTLTENPNDLFAIERRLAFFHGHGRLLLLAQKSVQTELALSADQIKRADDLLARQQAAVEALRNLNRDEMRKKFDELVQASEQGIVAILDPQQARRLEQISLQLRGPLVFQEPEVAEALKLTAEQKRQIQTILGPPGWGRFGHRRHPPGDGNDPNAKNDFGRGHDPRAGDDYRASHAPPPPPPIREKGGREKAARDFKASTKATFEKLLSVLTDDQKTKWQEMTGAHLRGHGGNEASGARPRRRQLAAKTMTGSRASTPRSYRGWTCGRGLFSAWFLQDFNGFASQESLWFQKELAMRMFTKLAVVGALVVLMSSAVLAQRPGGRGGFGGGFGGGGFGGGQVMLLSQKSVQEELRLSDEQVKKLKEVTAKQREAFQGMRDLSRDERAEAMKKIQEQGKAAEKSVAEILNADQAKRLKEISLQQGGAMAFANPEVAKALKFTDEQKEKLKTLQEAAGKARRELFENSGDRAEAGKKMEALRASDLEKAEAILTDEQRATWKGLTGKPFKLEIRPFGRRGNDSTSNAAPPRDRQSRVDSVDGRGQRPVESRDRQPGGHGSLEGSKTAVADAHRDHPPKHAHEHADHGPEHAPGGPQASHRDGGEHGDGHGGGERGHATGRFAAWQHGHGPGRGADGGGPAEHAHAERGPGGNGPGGHGPGGPQGHRDGHGGPAAFALHHGPGGPGAHFAAWQAHRGGGHGQFASFQHHGHGGCGKHHAQGGGFGHGLGGFGGGRGHFASFHGHGGRSAHFGHFGQRGHFGHIAGGHGRHGQGHHGHGGKAYSRHGGRGWGGHGHVAQGHGGHGHVRVAMRHGHAGGHGHKHGHHGGHGHKHGKRGHGSEWSEMDGAKLPVAGIADQSENVSESARIARVEDSRRDAAWEELNSLYPETETTSEAAAPAVGSATSTSLDDASTAAFPLLNSLPDDASTSVADWTSGIA